MGLFARVSADVRGKVTALLEGLIAVGVVALVERRQLCVSLSCLFFVFFYFILNVLVPALSSSLCSSSISASSALKEAIPTGTIASAEVLQQALS